MFSFEAMRPSGRWITQALPLTRVVRVAQGVLRKGAWLKGFLDDLIVCMSQPRLRDPGCCMGVTRAGHRNQDSLGSCCRDRCSGGLSLAPLSGQPRSEWSPSIDL
jgi:hypothetical protein